MKLEIGMYVRTKQGKIGKIKGLAISHGFTIKEIIIVDTYYNFVDENDSYFVEDLSKASHNIIDLIEVGDYVNGNRVEEIDWYSSIKVQQQKYLKIDCSSLFNALYEEDIKSIVTKEQFESMSYKVGE